MQSKLRCRVYTAHTVVETCTPYTTIQLQTKTIRSSEHLFLSKIKVAEGFRVMARIIEADEDNMKDRRGKQERLGKIVSAIKVGDPRANLRGWDEAESAPVW